MAFVIVASVIVAVVVAFVVVGAVPAEIVAVFTILCNDFAVVCYAKHGAWSYENYSINFKLLVQLFPFSNAKQYN